MSLVVLATLVAVTSGAVAPLAGTSGISEGAVERVNADLAAGALQPADLVFEVEGPLEAAAVDPNPGVSGIAGVLAVDGMSFRVPVGVPVRVGDNPGEAISIEDILNTPVGHDDLLVRSTVIATGTIELVTNETGTVVVYTANDVFLEKAENVLFGLVTSNSVSGFFINGVKVKLETDPRFAPFVTVVDLAQRPIRIADIPEGVLVGAEGAYDRDASVLKARIVEVDAILAREPGETDFISVERAEVRSVRQEMRVRGFGNEPAATLTIYDYTGDVRGTLLASGIELDPADGAWEFRGTVPLVPNRIRVESDFGGVAAADVSVR